MTANDSIKKAKALAAFTSISSDRYIELVKKSDAIQAIGNDLFYTQFPDHAMSTTQMSATGTALVAIGKTLGDELGSILNMAEEMILLLEESSDGKH